VITGIGCIVALQQAKRAVPRADGQSTDGWCPCYSAVFSPFATLRPSWQNLTSGQGDAKSLTAYVGLDPQPYESGRSVRKQPGISKMGDSEIRRLLYMGALGGVQGPNPLKPFDERLVGRAIAKKVALVAAATKILVWAWTIFSCQAEWDPAFHAH
jgi:hypothetical protein